MWAGFAGGAEIRAVSPAERGRRIAEKRDRCTGFGHISCCPITAGLLPSPASLFPVSLFPTSPPPSPALPGTPPPASPPAPPSARSEERRVGKEGRAGYETTT